MELSIFVFSKLSKCQTKAIKIRYGLGTAMVRRWYGANLKKIEIHKERKWFDWIAKLQELSDFN